MRAALPAEVPVLVAGGLANGSQLAGMLAMGAAGAVYGTRFLLAPESKYNDSQRAALLAASSSSTARTMAFDHARSTLGWPAGVDGRGLRNGKCRGALRPRRVQLYDEHLILNGRMASRYCR